MASDNHVFAVILAGGGGTRLWPKSRNQSPKQFLKLMGRETMLQLTASRIIKLVPWSNIIVVTNAMYKDEVAKQLPQVPVDQIIAEPKKNDTALAMLVGALYAKSLDKDAVVINAASDHVVGDETEFVKVMEAAAKVAAKKENLVTIGITPTFPSSGFGYIRIGEELTKIDRSQSLFKVVSFIEKPNEATARAYIATGKYFWNANMYVWSSDALTDAFAKYMPKMYDQTKKLATITGQDFHAALPAIYDQAESISIDYAISEKADNLVLIPGGFGWNDVGDWKVVFDLSKKNLEGNVILGEGDDVKTLTINAHDNLIHTDGRLVALIGIDDMIVVDTPEILMVAPKKKSQDVKKLVERLKEEDKKEYL